jgi:uncharacterized protein
MAIPGIEPCRPPFWARGGHLQTILAHLLPHHVPKPDFQTWIIDLPDGDKLNVRFFPHQEARGVVYLFHGLGGSVDSDYMRGAAWTAHARGYHVVAVNHRGCGQGRGLAKDSYHAGRVDDLQQVIGIGKQRFPALSHIAIGFSLSGNTLLLLMSDANAVVLPDIACAVNAPIDLTQASARITRGLNKIYDWRYYARCKAMIKERVLDGLMSAFKFPWLSSLETFDELYTAKQAGFANRKAYYNQCSAAPHLHRISKPTLILSSADDPFVEPHHYTRASISPLVRVHIEKFGGHMGYLHYKKTREGTRRWLDYALGVILGDLQNIWL